MNSRFNFLVHVEVVDQNQHEKLIFPKNMFLNFFFKFWLIKNNKSPQNTDCSNGEVCCPQGCNKICKQPLSFPPRKPTPRPPTPPSGDDDSCPPPSATFGACVFDPSVNCVDSSGCLNGKICCADGCGKVCKDPVGPKKPPAGVCPVSLSGDGAIVGACVYDPSRNCGDHGDCKNGKLCCSVGCGKECINPEPEVVHPATKPQILVGQNDLQMSMKCDRG